MAKTRISFTRIISGISDYNKESVLANSVAFSRRVDWRTNPRRWTLLPKPAKESGTVIVDLPKWGERVGTDVYLYGDAGNIYKRTSGGTVTLERSVSISNGNGLKYYGEDDFLYYTRDKVIGRYGRIGGTPSYVDDFLGAQGGVPLNTAVLDLEASSSQYATAADSATNSITGDLALSTYRKFESLPVVGSEMVLMSKWNENGNLRSYKFSVYAVSGYFGDGSDGTLTISSNTTESPIDSTASGTSGTNTLTATNTSFAADQIVLVMQMRGTGAGTWQRNKITGYVAGTVTLEDNLNFSYNTSGSDAAQIRVMPQYDNVTVNSGITYSTKDWDGSVGGIMAFLADTQITVTGTIEADGGAGSVGDGTSVAGGTGAGFSGGYGDHANPSQAQTGEGTTGDHVNSSSANGNGGGGAGISGASPGKGGGGGGNGTAGTTAGATGGSTAGSADLTTMVLGGGGGGGANDGSESAGTAVGGGGCGGGIIFLTGTDITVTGGISADGGAGGNAQPTNEGGDGGGGAGGSILLKVQTATLGSGLVTADGGTGNNKGGAGGDGRIHIDYYTSYTGTTSPTIDATQDESLVTNTSYQLRLQVSDDGTNLETYGKTLQTLTTAQWIHLAVSWDASESEADFYEDAVDIGTSTGSMTSLDDNASLFAIGASFDSSGNPESFFDGKTDEDRLWSVTRTQAQFEANKDVEIGALASLEAYYQHDSSTSDSSANSNTLTHVNTPAYDTDDVPFSSPTTRLDIDQQDTSSGDTYSVPTAIDEGSTARQTFVPTKDPQKSIEVNIGTIGTNADWTLTVHDAQNREIATVTVANEDLNTGNYEFVFDSVWTPVVGASYHFHLTVDDATGTPAIVSGSSGDLETGQFTSYYQFLIEDTDYHPIEQIINKLVIGNGRYVATWDATTYTPHELTFPSGWRVRCFGLWREYLAIGCWRGTGIDDYDQGIIFFWDGISDTYNFYINVPEGGINAMIGSQSTLYIVAGYEGHLLEYKGGDKATKVKQIPQLGAGEQIEIHPAALTVWRTLLRIGAGVTDSSAVEQGVYTWGSLNKNYPDSLSYDYTISTGNSENSNIEIGMLLPIDKNLLIGWKDNISYGLDSVDPSGNPYADGSIEFLIRDEGNIYKEKTVDLIRADFEALASSESIGLQYKLDRASSWSTEETETTAAKENLRVQVNNSRHREYQVRVNLKTSTTTSPAVLGVTVAEDELTDEEYI